LAFSVEGQVSEGLHLPAPYLNHDAHGHCKLADCGRGTAAGRCSSFLSFGALVFLALGLRASAWPAAAASVVWGDSYRGVSALMATKRVRMRVLAICTSIAAVA
jgi:hypothetical protein